MNSPSPGLNVATRHQQGGTCWFHAIVNGLIMSAVSRKYLLRLLRERGFSPSKSALSSGACPRTIDGFWKYIAYRLKGPKSISPRIRNVNAIKAAGLRRNKFANPMGFIPRIKNTMSTYRRRALASRTSVTGGTISDLYNLYKKLFGSDFSYRNGNSNKKNPAFMIVKGDSFPVFKKTKDEYIYKLSHAYIQMTGLGGFWGHAITGFINSRGNFKLYDSNNAEETIDWDWNNSNNKNMLDEFNKWYGFPKFFNLRKVKKYAIYIRYDLIL
jgi:hypothetical protein